MIAAEELQQHIHKMSGATLPIIELGQPLQGAAVLIGRAAPKALAQRLARETKDTSAFVLTVDDNTIAFTGLVDPKEADTLYEIFLKKERDRRQPLRVMGYTDQGKGTTIAAYELLEQLDVRWYTPGDWGMVMPQRSTIVIKTQDQIHKPVIRSRLTSTTVSHDRVWDRCMRQGGPQFPSSHGLPGFGHSGKELYKDHPL